MRNNELQAKILRSQKENEELKKYQYTQEYLQNEIEKRQKALEEIREVINCSDKNDCDNCPRNDFCEELCDSKENLIYVLKTMI